MDSLEKIEHYILNNSVIDKNKMEELYMNWIEENYNKIINKEEIDLHNIRELVWDDSIVIDTIYGENRRWSRSVSTIIQLKDKYFRIDWEEGLTEKQEDEYYNQPYEVKLVEKERIIIDKIWVEL